MVHDFSCCYVGFLLCYSKQRQLDIALRKIEMFSVEVNDETFLSRPPTKLLC